jgi:hypothetical protein
VLPLLDVHARVPLCSLIAHYNDRNCLRDRTDCRC